MDQVITFDKSLSQRLKEYRDVLSGYETLPVSAIQKEWSFYLELTLDLSGWQAVWKVQRSTCERLGIPFPTVVLVFVVNVDLSNLTALVKVLAVQDDIHIPYRHHVPLAQLWPTKEQDRSVALNLQTTANGLDMLRFFYNHLLMPWDHDDDDTLDWRTKLEPRLRLYYVMKNGALPRATAEHLHSLLTEAKHIQIKREKLESRLVDLEDNSSENVDNRNLETLTELHIRMLEIKFEVEVLENPLLRNGVIKRQQETVPERRANKRNVWLVYEAGRADDYIRFLDKIKLVFPNEDLRFVPNLWSTLQCANDNDVYILNESSHSVKTTGALECGGVLKGIFDREKTVLTSDVEDVMLDFSGESVSLENLTIDAGSAQCAIIVRRGHLALRNCRMVGDRKSSTHQGIIVLPGANLEIVDCDIGYFFTAIVGNSGSVITIESSDIHDVNYGLKLYENCTVKGVKTTIRDCKEYGVCIETETSINGDEPKVGDFDILNIIPQLQIEFMKGDNNSKGDAVINQKAKLKPFEDLFENPDLDPTICASSSDEEMESYERNNTVIERPQNISPATV